MNFSSIAKKSEIRCMFLGRGSLCTRRLPWHEYLIPTARINSLQLSRKTLKIRSLNNNQCRKHPCKSEWVRVLPRCIGQ